MNSVINDVEFIKGYEYYDQWLLWLGLFKGKQCLVYCVDPYEQWYLMVEVSQERLTLLESDAMDIRTAFLEPESGEIWSVSEEGGKQLFSPEFWVWGQPVMEWLPDSGICLC